MTRNPILNALSAALYIVLIVNAVFLFADQGPDTILTPMLVLSLFVLSAAVMGFIFLYHPLQLLVEGKNKEAVSLFLQTVGYFAGLTVIFLVLNYVAAM